MVTSAFKSSSRRVAPETKATKQPAALRRSRSVNAVSRKTHLPLEECNSISSEFSVRRDNPLFWTSSSSPPEKEAGVSLRNGEIKPSSVCEARGRSVTRNGSVRNGIGRSLSRVRGRSVSRAQDKGLYEVSENEMDGAASTNARSRNKRERISDGTNRIISARNKVDTKGSVKNPGITANQKRETECSEDESALSMKISHLEDELSICSLSEAEEKTIKAISDDFNVFRRDNENIVTATCVPDIPPDMVNPTVVGLTSDIRREYSIKLQESEERARKLRTDLAIEEHRGKELNRILKELIPDSKTSCVQKSRRGRRTSNERKWVSNRLSEEAMAYFDECVSLSTFDSSDFSAPEDPPYSSVSTTIAVHSSSPLKGGPCNLSCYDQSSDPHEKQVMVLPHPGSEGSGNAIKKSSSEPGVSIDSYQFSFADKQSENESIRSYIKQFERGGAENGIDMVVSTRTCYDRDGYIMRSRVESVFIDKVLYLNRIKSGSLLLCEGCAISCLPFS
ncbi:hypothetical protein F511_09744 [Dorcoceras hygrometricum]|uniref:Uncharacterized protein n=1 Tax=Dorcoceras hygrometricum TaxID=472368 RepID=A0A2Z7D7A0_9LAMI|nr:hypothetical protein F511_09744 [Dorcoceras hygrometricum]